MTRDSGGDQPTQRTVAELLAEYGGGTQRSSRRRRRRAEDPSETAPQAIIERVLSDTGQLRAVQPDSEPPQRRSRRTEPPAAQPPAPQPGPQPQQAAAPEAPAPEPPRPAEPPVARSASYWAQRFAAAGKNKAAVPPEADAEATIQQPVVRRPAPQQEGMTEQLPRVEEPAPAAPEPEGTAMLAYSPPVEEQAEPEDPYDFESYDEPEADYVEDDYDPELPAGMDAEDYGTDEEEEEQPSARKEWGTLALQGIAGLVGGGLVWFGFRWLWITNPLAALGAALVITGCLVLIAWKFLRTNDLQTILLAVLVGLFCTVSPAALLLISH